MEFTRKCKKTWDVIKEVTGTKKYFQNNLPKIIKTNNYQEISKKDAKAEKFNDFFTNVGKNLAEKIESSSTTFDSYLKTYNSKMLEVDLSLEELGKAFKTLQPNKGKGLDEINVNIIRSVFDIIKKPLHFIFNLSLKQGIFPRSLKIARVVPVFKSGEESIISNYRPISILPCFSKLLERIMYNRL